MDLHVTSAQAVRLVRALRAFEEGLEGEALTHHKAGNKGAAGALLDEMAECAALRDYIQTARTLAERGNK